MAAPVVVSIDFQATAGPGDSQTAEQCAARFVGRTVAHLDHVDVGAIVSAYLEKYMPGLDPDDDPMIVAEEALRLVALVETVLGLAKERLQTRMLIDAATTLVPRLAPIPSKEIR